jgi:ATP-binding cassette subfamily F protein 3
MQSKDVLKNALKDFNGTVICVSHDRDFLDGLVNKVYEFGGGKVREHLGGIYDFLRTKRIDNLQELERKDSGVQEVRSSEGESAAKLDYAAQKAAAAARRKKEKQIAEIEAAITKLEQEQKDLETLLSDLSQQTPENFQRYDRIKRDMEQRLYEWEILNE